jgi:hypothetical protein
MTEPFRHTDPITEIPKGTHFCCLALHGPRLRIKQEHYVLPGLIVSNKQDAFKLEPHWVEWLGTLQARSFEESTLFITAIAESVAASGNDLPNHEFMDRRVRLLHHTLVLLGCGYNDAVLMVGGERYRSGGLNIGPVRPGLTPCFRPSYRESRGIELFDLEHAAKILESLELIYRHVPDRLYRRLRKGFNVWVRGAEEGYDFNERLHSFVRAIEAILKPTIARQRSARARKRSKKPRWREVTPTFLHRGQTIIGRSARNERLLRQLYDIRSSIEHIKDVMPNVRKARVVDSEETFLFRALQAEILASSIYARILSNDQLRATFSTEARVEGFWRRNGPGRQTMWGSPMDLDAATRECFLPRNIPDSY